ncbi:MAG: hypothetical protein R3F49_12740 [Planctomycetota bacterium]
MPTFRWSPADELRAFVPVSDAGQAAAAALDDPSGLLAEQLASLAEDRSSGADEVARRVARSAHAWLSECGASVERSHAGGLVAALERELEAVWAGHGWRGPVLGLRAALSAAARAAEGAHADVCETLLEELALWCEDRVAEETEATWDGVPLGAGVRLPDRGRVAAPFLSGPDALERGEVVVVHGWSETVARTLEAAHRAGLAPEAVVSEGGPDLGGRRLARRLVAAGLPVRFIYDAAVPDAVRRADRVWIGTDAIGARAFVARVGTRVLLEEARRAEVSSAVLATSDKLVPGGELMLPSWCEGEPWLLWERPPVGVTIASQAYEAVPLEHAGVIATEFGLVTAAELALRALRTSSS